MTGVEAALAAMDTAEQEAHDAVMTAVIPLVQWWAYDRLRLIQRDRETLERHREVKPTRVVMEPWCHRCPGGIAYPCPDARAVIDHWENA